MADTEHKHEHHILPLRVYLLVGASLLFLTFVTVWIANFHFGPLNIVVAMLIAVAKASLVVLFFMHLLYDSKIYAAVFVLSIVTLGSFIGLSAFEIFDRDVVGKDNMRVINPDADLESVRTMRNIQIEKPAHSDDAAHGGEDSHGEAGAATGDEAVPSADTAAAAENGGS